MNNIFDLYQMVTRIRFYCFLIKKTVEFYKIIE